MSLTNCSNRKFNMSIQQDKDNTVPESHEKIILVVYCHWFTNFLCLWGQEGGKGQILNFDWFHTFFQMLNIFPKIAKACISSILLLSEILLVIAVERKCKCIAVERKCKCIDTIYSLLITQFTLWFIFIFDYTK